VTEFTPAQRRAIETLDSDVAVSAGAGAGKTRVLVERYLNILSHGRAACDGILAITFTNKAAKEMKDRIRKRAAELAAADDGETGRRWRAVLGELEYAPIGTFHSFCARVLRENPVEAGLDPNFAVLDEAETALLMEKALGEVFAAGLAADEAWLDSLLTAYDKTLFAAAVPGIYDQIAAQGLPGDGLAELLAEPYRRAIAAASGLKAELLRLCDELIACKDKLKKNGAQYARVEQLARDRDKVAAAVAAAAGDDAADAVLGEYLDCLDRRSGDREIVTAIRETLRRLRQVKADRAALALVPAFGRLLAALDAALAKYKHEQRVLTFTDLEVRTARLFAMNPAVRQRYIGRIRYIMVDEFQDTNDLQRQIVYLVAGGDATALRGRKLFVVGDAKQSIYRFRGADVAVFARVCADIAAAGGELIDLDVNFRSLDSLLALYNECFATLMGTAEDAIPFQPLAAFRRDDGPAGEARAEFIAVPKNGEGGRRAEAAAIAGRIAAMVGGGDTLVDRDAAPRPVCYGDIAVLFRTVTDLDTYAAALQTAGIPYYIVGGRGFYHRQEIIDVLNLLQAVENRGHQTALAGALRSPLFLLSDAALLALKRSAPTLWQGLERHAEAGLDDAQRRAAARAWRILGKLRGLRGAVGVARLIRVALAETGYPEFVLTQFMGQQKYANLGKLVAVADAFVRKGPATLGDFLRYVAKLVAGEVREGEAQVESEGGDTVKLMTIHKAKGLEFPVVFLPDLHRRFKDETGPVSFAAGHGLGLKVPAGGAELAASSVYEDIAGREKKLSLLELKRVLYVAFTRAKDYLVLSAVGDKVTTDKDFTALGTWLGWLGKVYRFGDLAALPAVLVVDRAPLRVSGPDTWPAAACAVTAAAIAPPADPGWLEELTARIAPLPPARREQVFTASDIGRFRQCPRAFYYGVVAALPEPPAGDDFRPDAARPPARVVGDVLHRCLELALPGRPAEEWLARAAVEKAPPHWREAVLAEVRPLLARYVAGELFRETARHSALREWRFTYLLPDPGGPACYTFTGRIDCLVDYGDGSVGIIDYKTDRVAAGDAAAKADEYAHQLALYAMAAAAAGRGQPRDARLHFLRPGVTVNVAVDETALATAAGELAAICRHIVGHGDEGDYAGNPAWCPRCGYRVLCTLYAGR
jgi:ATP-dependent helicase/nuclease subunit A